MYIHGQRGVAGAQRVDAHVKLLATHKQRVFDVALNDVSIQLDKKTQGDD